MPRAAARNRRLREESRARILEGSVSTFAEKGFHTASMDDVAASAGVSKGLAYFYFRSKDELLAQALKERVAHLFDVGAALDPAAPPRTRLKALVEALVANVRKEPDAFRLYLSLSLEKRLSKTAARSLRRAGAPLEAYLAAVRAIFADLGSPDPDLDALLFRSALLGVFLRWVRAIETVPVERLSARLVALFGGRR